MEKIVIKVENLSYTYPDRTAALDGINFSVAEGEKVALVGPNGAGKSTLLLLLNGVLEGSGAVIIDGTILGKSNLHEIRRKVGLVFQDPDDQLFSPTVFDDVAFAPLNASLSADVVRQRIACALEFVELNGYEKRSPFHLSFGEKKRVSLAGVLAQEPRILLLDEPTGNLDPKHRRQIINWMKQFNGTLLIATHDLDMAYEVSQRCVILNKGHVASEGTTLSVLSNESLLKANDLELPLSLNSIHSRP